MGKTIVSAGVCRAALSRERKVCYIKPVQTGELDEYFVQLYTNPQGISNIFLRTMHHWDSAMSPHLAAASDASSRSGKKIIGPVSDRDLVTGLQREINAFMVGAADAGGMHQLFTVVETAGGVLSPAPSKTLQADVYRSLRLPLILVGDSRLGGITTTLTAYESLRLRGYTVHAIVLIQHPATVKYGNVMMIQEHLHRSLSSSSSTWTAASDEPNFVPKIDDLTPWSVNAVPRVFPMSPLPKEHLLHNWYRENDPQFQALFDHVSGSVEMETRRLLTMRQKGQDMVWWPFTQHASLGDSDVTFIESAHGDKFRTLQPAGATGVTKMAVTTGSAEVAAAASFYSESDSVDGSGGAGSGGGEEVSQKVWNLEAKGGPRGLGKGGEEDEESRGSSNDSFDGCGSWWTQGVGHGHPAMALALAEAAGR